MVHRRRPRRGAPHLKHRLKLFVRDLYARVLWSTGLHRVVSRLAPRRLTVLYGHCVDLPEVNGDLSADMRIGGGRLERVLRELGRHHDLVTVGGGMDALAGGARGRSMVALSMDDGYRDNLTALVPLLERVGGRATVFLEAEAVLDRTLPWLHAFGWLVDRLGPEELGRRYAAAADDGAPVAAAGAEGADRLKRHLKYHAPTEERDRVLASLLDAEGGDARALCERLYLSPDEARELAGSERVEVGGHTTDHPVLARLAPEEQAAAIEGGRRRLAEALGEGTGATFAYPYGRRWDFDDASVTAAREAGYRWAVTTHAGTNRRDADPYRLARWPIDDRTPLHVLGCEACGGFELLRRLGIDLVE